MLESDDPHEVSVDVRGMRVPLHSVIGLSWASAVRKQLLLRLRGSGLALSSAVPISDLLEWLCEKPRQLYFKCFEILVTCVATSIEEFSDWPTTPAPWAMQQLQCGHRTLDVLTDATLLDDGVSRPAAARRLLRGKGFRAASQFLTDAQECRRYLDAVHLGMRDAHFVSVAVDASRVSGREREFVVIMETQRGVACWAQPVAPLLAAFVALRGVSFKCFCVCLRSARKA